MLIERIFCSILGHKYVVEKVLSSHARKIGCTRCARKWAMNDDTRTFVKWDSDFEKFYEEFESIVKGK